MRTARRSTKRKSSEPPPRAVTQPSSAFTSPLAGEVGAKRRVGAIPLGSFSPPLRRGSLASRRRGDRPSAPPLRRRGQCLLDAPLDVAQTSLHRSRGNLRATFRQLHHLSL